MTKVKITEEILETLNILDCLRIMKGVLNCNIYHDIEVLGMRCNTKNYELLADVLTKLGAEIIED